MIESRDLMRVPSFDDELTVRLVPWAAEATQFPVCQITGNRSAPIHLPLAQLRVFIHALKAAQEEMERDATP